MSKPRYELLKIDDSDESTRLIRMFVLKRRGTLIGNAYLYVRSVCGKGWQEKTTGKLLPSADSDALAELYLEWQRGNVEIRY